MTPTKTYRKDLAWTLLQEVEEKGVNEEQDNILMAQTITLSR